MSGEGAGGTDPGSATAAAERTGRAFVRALADKDAAALARLLADDVDFYGMTPARLWRARGARQAIDEVLLVWFEPDDLVQEVVSVEPACTWSSSAPTSTSSTTVTMTTPVAPPGASAA